MPNFKLTDIGVLFMNEFNDMYTYELYDSK